MFQMMPAKVLNGNVVIGRKQRSRFLLIEVCMRGKVQLCRCFALCFCSGSEEGPALLLIHIEVKIIIEVLI
jgi:hypothetical protein